MAQSSPQATASQTGYQPLSALAVIGFIVSCVFSGIVLISAVIALVQGAPFFFPSWVYLVAALGMLLSYAGASDIRNSEGTKAGAKLASWGMGMSLLCGLGYFAYAYFTGVALAQQATSFLMEYGDDSGFLPRLQKAGKDKGEFNRAFLLTLPTPDRSGAPPEDEATMQRIHDPYSQDGEVGKLSRFRQGDFVQAIVQGGADVRIETLGVQDWKYENKSYQVRRLYRIHTPDVAMTVGLLAKSYEGDAEGQARTWFFDIGSIERSKWDLTAQGQGLRRLRAHALVSLQKWNESLEKGEGFPEFAKVDATQWDKIHLDPAVREDVQTRARAVFAGKNKNWKTKLPMEPNMWTWERDDQGRVTVSAPFLFVLLNPGTTAHWSVETFAQLRTKTPVEPAQYALVDQLSQMPEWEIVGFKFTRAFQVQIKR